GLRQQGHQGKITAISRRGCLPLPYGDIYNGEPWSELTNHRTIREMRRSVRSRVHSYDGTWKDILNSIRPITNHLWTKLNIQERKRFIRHLKRYGETHRH